MSRPHFGHNLWRGSHVYFKTRAKLVTRLNPQHSCHSIKIRRSDLAQLRGISFNSIFTGYNYSLLPRRGKAGPQEYFPNLTKSLISAAAHLLSLMNCIMREKQKPSQLLAALLLASLHHLLLLPGLADSNLHERDTGSVATTWPGRGD